jgi:hypothetical protein
MIELKLSQGAKPAHGGMLPRAKISPAIAEARGLKYPPEGDCNSPARHSAFDSPEGMMRFIARLRELSGGKPVGFKLCLGKPEEFAALVRAMLSTGITPDFVTVDGGEGGTGAAPPEFSNSVGMPLAEGLTLVHAILTGAGLRDRVRVIAAGKVLTGFCKYTFPPIPLTSQILTIEPPTKTRLRSARAHARHGRRRVQCGACDALLHRVHPGAEMQHQHVPYGRHHAGPAPHGRAARADQGRARIQVPRKNRARRT